MKIHKYFILTAVVFLLQGVLFSQPNLDPDKTSEFFLKAMDYTSPEIRAKADEILKKYPGDHISQLCETFDMIYLKWKYKEHTESGEPKVKASKSIKNFTGDCKDYASLMVAMFIALGGNGRLVFIPTHVYPEVYLGTNMSESALDSVVIKINKYYEVKTGYAKLVSKINYHVDGDGTVWMNMDWQEIQPGAKFIKDPSEEENLIIYSNGKYKIEFLDKRFSVF